jgi:hypothetical protein
MKKLPRYRITYTPTNTRSYAIERHRRFLWWTRWSWQWLFHTQEAAEVEPPRAGWAPW